MMTIEDCLRAAFAALLRGDTAERDRYCRLAENLTHARDRVRAGGPLVKGEAIQIGDAIALPDRSASDPEGGGDGG
jgi:hypothetical protein